MAESTWPKTVQRLRRSGLGVFKFRDRQACGERSEYCARRLFYVDAGVAMNSIMNAFKEGASTPRCKVSAWMPSFIIEPTQQWR
jgi:hypothetical protein